MQASQVAEEAEESSAPAATRPVRTDQPEYSPFLEDYPNRVFFGDTHLHTAVSVDAGTMNRVGQEDALRFARGEQVMASSGQPAKLARPLDWLVIADHSDGMGFFNDLEAGKPGLLKFEQGKR